MDDIRKDRASSGIAGIDIYFSQNFAAQLKAGLCNSAFRLSLANRGLDQEKLEPRHCDADFFLDGMSIKTKRSWNCLRSLILSCHRKILRDMRGSAVLIFR
jgi:hypothetical protein